MYHFRQFVWVLGQEFGSSRGLYR